MRCVCEVCEDVCVKREVCVKRVVCEVCVCVSVRCV